ncbi:hypothetical protein vseg_017224 [Gypsophila vaccaria]
MCTLWMFQKLAKLQDKVMCKCSYIANEGGSNRNRRNKVLQSSSASSSRATNPVSSPSPSASRRRISTTFLSSPRGSQGRVSASTPRSTSSPRLDPRWVPASRDEARMFLPQIKRGKLKRRVTIGSNQSNSSGSGDVDEPDWPPFADEDYIVFCFEEDGAFHVVMEDSPKTLPAKFQCEYHGTVSCACTDDSNVNHQGLTSRRDCLLPSQEGDEEQMSPKLQQVEANDSADLLEMDKEVVRKESTESLECINGSVESTDSSRADWEEQLQDESTLQLEVDYPTSPSNLLSPPDFRMSDSLLPDTLFEEEIFLSPKSQLGLQMTISDLLKGDNDGSCSGSDESDVKDSQGDQLVGDEDDDEEACSESPKSSASNQSNSCSSFEFPVLQWEWIDSPVTWPRPSGVHFRKQKSKPSCLKCCKF